MTQLLTEAIRIANTLSEEDQNAIALTLSVKHSERYTHSNKEINL